MFSLVLMLLPVGILVFFVVLQKRQGTSGTGEGEGHAQLMRALGVPAGSPSQLDRHGRWFSFRYFPGGKNTPPTVRVTVNVDVANDAGAGVYRESGRGHLEVRPAMVMRRETGIDRFGKRIGLNREIQIGDALFDDAVYVETDAPDEHVQRTLADDRLRKAVRGLLDAGAQRVVLDETGLYAVHAVVKGSAYEQTIDRTIDLLADAAAALPLFKAGSSAKVRGPGVEVGVLVMASFVTAIVTVFGTHGPLDGGAARVGLGGGLALWAILVVVLVRFLGGRSDSLRRVAYLAVAGLVLLPACLYRGLCWVNQAYDTSPGVDHVTAVTRTWTTHGKSTTYYHVEVGSWRDGVATEELSVSYTFYGKAKPGMGISVKTHAGRLGWEWVDSFRLLP